MPKIETGIPLPPELPKWPWEKMGVGDSFLEHGEFWERLRTYASRYGRRLGFRFKVKRQNDDTVRVWRIE